MKEIFEKNRANRPDRPARVEDVLILDEEIIRLLIRRSGLMRRLRGGKRMASTPAASDLEKRLRRAWETQAGGLSRDPRFIRELFELVQDLDLQTNPESVATTPFNLAPARQPVDVDLPGPVHERTAQCWLALTAAAGQKTRLRGLARTDGLQDSIRAFTWCGARTDWVEESPDSMPGMDCLEITGSSLEFQQGAILVGEDAFTFYLLAFLGIAQPGRIRFVGGSRLKTANFSGLAHCLPLLGARLAWVVPGSKGLPVALECSGMLPDMLDVPEDLPLEALSALCLAALVWPGSIRLNCAAFASEDLALALEPLRPLFQALSTARYHEKDRVLEFLGRAALPDVPGHILLDLDPALAVFWLCLPLFAGGKVTLRGHWPDTPLAREAGDLLDQLPVLFQAAKDRVSCEAAPGKGWPEHFALGRLDPSLHPLFWVLNARLAHKNKGSALIPRIPEGADTVLAEEFLAQAGFGLRMEDPAWRLNTLDPEDFKERAAKKHGWSSPDTGWGLALSLAAFLRANLKLNNPDCVPALWPGYWQYYNTLPNPRVKSVALLPPPAAGKRKIIM